MWQLQNLPQLNAANKFLSYVLEDLSHEVAFLSGNMLLFLIRGLSSVLYEPASMTVLHVAQRPIHRVIQRQHNVTTNNYKKS